VRVLLIGDGSAAWHLARRFDRAGHDVTAVLRDADRAAALAARIRGVVVVGDGTDPGLLERVGARRAEAVLALTAQDHENLSVCLVARRRFGVPRTVALVHDPDHEEVFRRLGVTAAVSATSLVSRALENLAGLGHVASMLFAAEGRVAVSEVVLPEGSPAVDRALRETTLPRGALVGCIFRDGGPLLPRAETRLQPGDRLLLIAPAESQTDVVAAFSDAPR
jgi:trk system potassium uptake protein TrkA